MALVWVFSLYIVVADFHQIFRLVVDPWAPDVCYNFFGLNFLLFLNSVSDFLRIKIQEEVAGPEFVGVRVEYDEDVVAGWEELGINEWMLV